jgi:hypothetical protein
MRTRILMLARSPVVARVALGVIGVLVFHFPYSEARGEIRQLLILSHTGGGRGAIGPPYFERSVAQKVLKLKKI